jgi:hypothetical protein
VAFYAGWPVATSFLLLVRREVQKLASETGGGNADPAEPTVGEAEGGPW